MKTLLVLAGESGLASAVRSVLDPTCYRVLSQTDVAQAERLLREGSIDACLLDAELTDIRPIRTLERLRRLSPDCPILVLAANRQWEWEEDAYLLGVAHVLPKPVRPRLLNALLDRLWREPGGQTKPNPTLGAMLPAEPVRTSEAFPFPTPVRAPVRTLEALRDFSSILSHSLNSEALLRQFLLLLRGVIGVNRAAIFLRSPLSVFNLKRQAEDRGLRATCALGLSPELLGHVELSLESGIGGYAHRKGRILLIQNEAAHLDREIQKEFELLGVQIAIPILDREVLIGVAVFDGRLTGVPFSNEELELIFHLLEELGLAIRNSWLHDQLVANHEMMADILNQSGSACVVINRDLVILHSNQAARRFFVRPERGDAPLEFSDLPQGIGSRAFESLQSGIVAPPFKFRPAGQPEVVYRVSVVPFKSKDSVTTNATLLLVEDFSQSEKSQQLEIEASNLRLVKSMAEHLAHEIGNSLVPLSTHQQLLAKKYSDPEFRASLEGAMGDAVHRIARLSNQMLFLARDNVIRPERVPVTKLIEEAFREAQKHYAPKPASLVYDSGGQSVVVSGDHAGLKQALSEVMLNALQANPPNAPVQVRSGTNTDASGSRWVQIEVRDAGPGFSDEAVRLAATPFFSTRNVGLGLGLAVTRKIVETHRGKFEVPRVPGERPAVVRISLPLG